MRGRAVASLHSGDRAGTRYYNVMAGGDGSGRIRDGFTDQVTAFALNPHVEIGGLELFGVLETTSGNRAGAEDDGLMIKSTVSF